MIGAEPALGDPAADGGAEDAVEHGAGAGKLAGFRDGEADGIVEKFRYPVGDAAHGEGQHSQAEGGGEEGGIAEETRDGGAIGGRLDVVLRAAHGLAAEESVECGDDQSREWRR